MKISRILKIFTQLIALLVLSGVGRWEISPGHAAEQDVSVYLPLVRGGNVLIAHQNVDFIGHIGGTINAIAVQGNYAYIGEGASLTILDISNAQAPAVVGETGLMQDLVRLIAVAGDYVYLVTGLGYIDNELIIIDVSDPTHPFEVGSCDCGMYIPSQDMAVAGNYVYVVSTQCYHEGCWGDLRLIDVSDPSNPYLVCTYPSFAYSVSVVNGYAYLASAGLRIFDVSVPANPIEVGYKFITEDVRRVDVIGGYAYIASYHYLRVMDITDPANMSEVGLYETDLGIQDMTAAGDYAYLATEYEGLGGMRVIDISDPANPFEVGSYDTQGIFEGIIVAGGYVYLRDTSKVMAIDVSVAPNPVYTGSYSSPGPDLANSLAAAQDYAYVTDPRYGDWSSALRIIDVSNPANPTEVGSVDILGYPNDVALGGNYAYLVLGPEDISDYSTGGLRVIDISNPANPLEVAFYQTKGYAAGVTVAGDYAYVAEGSDYYGFWDAGLQVIDISDPSNPSEAGSIETAGSGFDVVISSGFAYLAARDGGLRVIDISDPANPVEVGVCATPGEAGDVAIAGNYAYVSDWQYGLRIIDISDPTYPFEAGYFEAPHGSNNVSVVGEYAYLANYNGGMRVIDVTDPANPVEVGFFDTPFVGMDVAVIGSFVLVADGYTGMLILKYTGVKDASSTNIPRDQPDPSIAGVPFPVRVEVDAGFGIPGGTVDVSVAGEEETCSASLVGGIGSCLIALDATGTYTLTASYSGDQYFLPSTSALITHTVVTPALFYLPWVGGK